LKLSKRFLALTVALLFCAALLSACADNSPSSAPPPGGESPQDGASPSPVDVFPDLDKFVFTIATFHPAELNPQEDLGTPLNARRLDIIEQIERDYNCTINVMDMPPDQILDQLQTAVFAGDKLVDAFITTCWAFGPLMGAGLLLDLNRVETLDLNAPWWLQSVTDVLTVDGKVLGTMGSFTHPTFPGYNMHFNKTLWEELQLECPYELVRKGEWTWEKMMGFANAAKKDLDGDGIVNSPDDRWGIVAPGEDFTRALLFSTGVRVYNTHPVTGRVELACNNQEAYEKIEFLGRFFEEPGLFTTGSSWDSVRSIFLDGRALFISSQVDSDFRMMDYDFGVLPMPKWDAAQPNYVSAMDHNGKVLGVPRTNTDLFELGHILDALGKAFVEIDTMRIEEFEDTRYRSEEDGEMLEKFIRGTTFVDLVIFLKDANNALGLPMRVIVQSADDIAYEMESIADMIAWQLDEFFGFTEE
jgi:ABC-type glycerol-3-phosphate transport system substrate-binding protein